MKKLILMILVMTFSVIFSKDLKLDLEFPEAIKERRQEYKEKMKLAISSEMKAFRLSRNENSVKKIFEYMQILNYLEDDGFEFLKLCLEDYPKKSEAFYSSVLETIYTLYEKGFEEEMQVVMKKTTNPKQFIIASYFLLRIFPEKRFDYLDILNSRFKNLERFPNLNFLSKYLEDSPLEYLESRPPLKDLFSHNYGDNKYIVFSLQRENRDYPGLCIIRKPDGTFYRRMDGSIFAISQLARSVSNMPSLVVNGNTPQGIFSIKDIQVAKSEVIGPTPALITAMPFEMKVGDFFHSPKKNNKWSLGSYLSLFPSSWKSYLPIQESYIAGEIGRGAIYAHGTTVDTEFYRDDIFYPNTPTKGCLSSKEIWSTRNGKCRYSDQVFLVNAVKSLGDSKGYLIVVNIDKREMPVSLDDVLMEILEAEEGRD